MTSPFFWYPGVIMKIIKPHESLDFISPYLPSNPLIVEAGAFTGTDSVRIANHWPHAQIHSLEPVPELFSLLRKKTKEYENIISYELGLGTYNGTAQLHLAEKPNRITQASSLLPPKERLKESPIQFNKIIEIPITTLDKWATQNSIDHIDLLWLDLQGIELDVLKASPHILKKIKAIHIEVATIERYTGQPLYQETKKWLESHGFIEIARDFDPTKRHFGNSILIAAL